MTDEQNRLPIPRPASGLMRSPAATNPILRQMTDGLLREARQAQLRRARYRLGDFEKGLKAYQSGDYQTALHEWRPLAEQGDAKAQNNLGVMYEKGLGVPQDYAEAVKWYRKAAEQGDARAQNNLGVMYAAGRGVQ
jgi:TPR repeat protein